MTIAAVVNLHTEGSTATPSLISAFRACERARNAGLDVTLVLMLDTADEATTSLANHWANRYGATVVTASLGDLGLARNHAAGSVSSDHLAYLDGDDLWGEEWLIAAYAHAQTIAVDVPVVLHPQINVIFGDHHSLLHHIDSTNPDFRWSRFHLHNAWTALSFVRRELILEMPYPHNDLTNGYGYEDWSWNMAVLDAGGQHLVVPETCHFIKRVDSGSLLGRSQRALRTQYPHSDQPSQRVVGPQASHVDSGTHVNAPVALSQKIKDQIGLVATAEPAVEDTLRADGTPSVLPQNFNTHNTPAQFALEELWDLKASRGRAVATVADICDQSSLLEGLPADDRTHVVAEFLRTEQLHGRAVGESPLISEAAARYSQLASSP